MCVIVCHMRRRIHVRGRTALLRAYMRRRTHVSYEEEDTCVIAIVVGGMCHMRRRIHVS